MAEQKQPPAASEGGKQEKPKTQKKTASKLLLPSAALFSLVAIVFLQVTYIFLLIGMLPSIVAFIVDRRQGKPAFQTVATFNLAGMLHYLAELVFIHRNSPAAVQQMMSDVMVWFTIYSAATLGWIMILGLPYLMNFVLAGIHSGHILRLESIQKKLEDTWGPEIKRRQ